MMRTNRSTLLLALGLAFAPVAASARDLVADLPRPTGTETGVLDPKALEGIPKTLTALSGPSRRQVTPSVKAAIRAGYRPLSELTGGAYPAFSPGIGQVYAKREQLPTGPFLAYDHKGRQVSTIYKFSLDRMGEKANFDAKGARMPPVDHVSGYFSGSHPGVDFPHYSFVFWHVAKKDESRVAK